MTPWNAAILRTADSLAALLAEPARPVDLDVAITARAAVLDHVSTVLADVAPRTRTRHSRPIGHAVPISFIEADPLDGLGRVLHGRIRPVLQRAPSELLDASRLVDAATSRWVDAGRYAVVATRAWTPPLVGRNGEHGQQVVAEVAVLAEAVAVLDRDLLAQAGEQPWVRQVIESTAGLRIAAREVLALHGAVRESAAAAQPNDPAAITAALAGRSGKAPTLSRDVRRLTAFLGDTPALSPHHVRACARVGRGLAVLAARDAVSTGGADLRDELGALARGLHAVATRDGREFSINPVQARAFELQLRDVHATTKLHLAGGRGLGEQEATRVARRLPDLVDLLHHRVRGEIASHQWAILDRAPDAQLPYVYASVTELAHVPPMLGPLAEAKAGAAAVRAATTEPLQPSGLADAVAAARTLRSPVGTRASQVRAASTPSRGLAR